MLPIPKDNIIDHIHQFWFGQLIAGDDPIEKSKLWWQKNSETDEYIIKNFKTHLEAAVRGEYDRWLTDSRGCLALIILADQFSRHIYRNDKKSFENDALALKWAQAGIDAGLDKGLHLFERAFFYMPFEHAEDLAAQQYSVKLFKELLAEASPKQVKTLQIYGDSAVQHHDIIEKFSRFPHRNQILERQTTNEEHEYLRTEKNKFW